MLKMFDIDIAVMTRVLKAVFWRSSENEATGERSLYKDEVSLELDEGAAGKRVFQDNAVEGLSGMAVIESVGGDGAVVSSGCERFCLSVGKTYRTSVYTEDGNHSWWYEFDISL